MFWVPTPCGQTEACGQIMVDVIRELMQYLREEHRHDPEGFMWYMQMLRAWQTNIDQSNKRTDTLQWLGLQPRPGNHASFLSMSDGFHGNSV